MMTAHDDAALVETLAVRSHQHPDSVWLHGSDSRTCAHGLCVNARALIARLREHPRDKEPTSEPSREALMELYEAGVLVDAAWDQGDAHSRWDAALDRCKREAK